MIFNKNGQSLLEYSILFAVVLSALLIMQFYVKRGYQGRLKQESDKVGQQYAPGHTTGSIVTDTASTSVTTVEDGVQSVVVSGGSTVVKDEHVDAFSAE